MKRPTKVTRRVAVKSGLAVALSTVACQPLLGQEKRNKFRPKNKPPRPMGRMRNIKSIAHLLPEDEWANMVGEEFVVQGQAYDEQTNGLVIPTNSKLKLANTSNYVPSRADLDRPKELQREFATYLTFTSRESLVYADCTYLVSHRWLGQFELFLSYTKLNGFGNQIVYLAAINN